MGSSSGSWRGRGWALTVTRHVLHVPTFPLRVRGARVWGSKVRRCAIVSGATEMRLVRSVVFDDSLRRLESGGTEVDVSRTKLTESQVKELGDAIGKSGKVTKLVACGCGITSMGAAALA